MPARFNPLADGHFVFVGIGEMCLRHHENGVRNALAIIA